MNLQTGNNLKLFSLKNLEIGDIITIFFINFISVLNLIYCCRINTWWIVVLGNILTTIFILLLVNYANDKKGVIRIVRDWYWYPFILIIFKEIYLIIQSLHLPDLDVFLIKADRFIFGTDPTMWLYQFANPVLTEILQICYSSFYFILLAVPFYAYIKNRKEEFYTAYFYILFGFYLSYIGYLLVPAIGPRFTIHNFLTLEKELPGLLLSDWLRLVINIGESIQINSVNAAMTAQRDCFPSGHTEMTLIAIYLSFRFNQKIKWLLLILGTGLIIGTMYLRYHYVIDVICGAISAGIIFWAAPPLEKWWKNKIKKSSVNI
jgi:membrane-associated phospholipid phosphatase